MSHQEPVNISEGGVSTSGEAAVHDGPHANYLGVFYALCGLTALSVVADLLGGALGKGTVTMLVLLIASAKAMFVMLYFMHLKFEGRWKYALLAPTIVLAAGLVVTLSAEFGVHYYEMLGVFENGAEAVTSH